PAFEWVHVQLHQQKGMISLSPPTICNSATLFMFSVSQVQDWAAGSVSCISGLMRNKGARTFTAIIVSNTSVEMLLRSLRRKFTSML
ncbi:hypothetical protein ACSD88_004707, partial [Salmonella enterica subsp. enterica serovar Infantis]